MNATATFKFILEGEQVEKTFDIEYCKSLGISTPPKIEIKFSKYDDFLEAYKITPDKNIFDCIIIIDKEMETDVSFHCCWQAPNDYYAGIKYLDNKITYCYHFSQSV